MVWKCNKTPEINDIFDAWESCYEAHQDRLIAELEKLNPKQQDLMKILAVNPIDKPGSHTFLQVAKMSASTIIQTLNTLTQKDMVYRVKKIDKLLPHILDQQYRVLDPLLAKGLRKYA